MQEEAFEKLAEILYKIRNNEYSGYDQLEDLSISIIEITVKDSKEKEEAKKMLSLARREAERLDDLMFGKCDNYKSKY